MEEKQRQTFSGDEEHFTQQTGSHSWVAVEQSSVQPGSKYFKYFTTNQVLSAQVAKYTFVSPCSVLLLWQIKTVSSPATKQTCSNRKVTSIKVWEKARKKKMKFFKTFWRKSNGTGGSRRWHRIKNLCPNQGCHEKLETTLVSWSKLNEALFALTLCQVTKLKQCPPHFTCFCLLSACPGLA